MADNVLLHTPTVETSDEMKNMYLNFYIGSEVYGMEIKYVLQIVGMPEITEMPEMPLYMKGFIKFRDGVIPAVSMRLRFGKAEDEEYTDRTCIVVVRVGEKDIGLIVDAIRETITIEPENVLPQPTPEVHAAHHSLISGIAKLPDGQTSILVNVQNLFDGQM